MIQRMTLGLIGGALIALSVFLNGNTFTPSTAPSTGASWVLLVAGAAAAVFSLFAARALMGIATGAAAAVAAAEIVDMAQADVLHASAQMVVLVVGILATGAAMIKPRKPRAAAEAEGDVPAKETQLPKRTRTPDTPEGAPQAVESAATEKKPSSDKNTTSTGSIPVSAGV